ncbi:MAG: YbaK/EbsC family protein [Gammaproteobacteria bacterium]|nr:MAG: YbaK/EbsC family protein [Gammaproteobacteria bacterium]
MAISITLRDYLDSFGIQYRLVSHPRSLSSSMTAEAARIPGRKLAKAVVVESDDHPYVVVVPATHRVDLGELRHQFGRLFQLADEATLSHAFRDCECGAVPAAAQAFGLPVLVEECLLDCDEVFFEAGDHTALVRMSGPDFEYLMAQAGQGHFSRPA